MQKGSLFSTSLPTFFFFLFDSSQPTRCNAISHCGFDDWQYQTSMHVPIKQLYFSLEKVIFGSPAHILVNCFLALSVVLVAQSCPSCLTLGDPLDSILPGSSVHGIL